MIDLAAPVRNLDGVTVFADHADPTRFHYVPVRPRLVVDGNGVPDVKLVKYHLDPATQGATGAGLFSLTVDVGVDDAALAQVRDKVAAAVGQTGLTLTPVWPDSGSCRLILLDSSNPSGLVASVIGGATPSLAADATTLFVCSLDPAGVGIVEQALRTGGLPFGVVYNLQVAALQPALRASITADYQYAYHYYENRLHGGRLLLATDIGATVQDLVQQQAIRITVDDLVPDADKGGIYQQALDAVQQYVLQTLFTPTLSQAPPAQDTGGGSLAGVITGLVGLFTITYSLETVDTAELKTLTYNLAVARAEEITLAPQGELSALLAPGQSVDALIVAVDPAPPDQLNLDVATLVELTAAGIDHIDVTVSYNGADTTLTLDAANPRKAVSVWYAAAAGLEAPYRYDVQLSAAGPKGLAGMLTSPAHSSVHDIIRIDPRELYRTVEIRPVLMSVPFDRFPSVIVDVEAREALDGWTATDTVTLNQATQEAAVAYRGRPDGLISVRARLRYVRATGEELARDWTDVDPGPLVIGDPEPDVVTVEVVAAANFGDTLTQMVVELRSLAAPTTVSTLTLNQTSTAASWSYVPTPQTRGYEYRVTTQAKTGAVQTGQWLSGPAEPVLVVGEGFTQLRQVQVVFVGTTLANAGLLALRIRLTFADSAAGLQADNEFLAQDPLAPITWRYPVADPAHQDYTFAVSRIKADGTTVDDPPLVGSDLLRVLPVVAAHP